MFAAIDPLTVIPHQLAWFLAAVAVLALSLTLLGVAGARTRSISRPLVLFIGAVVLQLVLLAWLGATKACTLYTGRTVTLRVLPVDPRDIFRGDYISLNYDINSLPATSTYRDGQTVYVVLKRAAGVWKATSVFERFPELGPEEVAISGKVDYTSAGRAHIRYGIEQFFVPEGQGAQIERRRPSLQVEIAVDRFGNSALKRMLLNGQEIGRES